MTRMLVQLLCVFLFSSGLLACSVLQRSSDSGYYGSEQEYRAGSGGKEFYRERLMHIEQEAREELGMDFGLTLSEVQRQVLNERLALKRLERNIPNQREKRQYYKYRGAMRNDRERMQFLKLPSLEARERFAATRGLSDSGTYSDSMAQTIEKNDVAVGMTQKAVMQSWGDPDIVEVAGDPVYGNERWRYSKYVSSDEGFQKQTRVIYFESGRVVGWETY